jgi:hypothetical protein
MLIYLAINSCRNKTTRTSNLLLPKQAFYQIELYSETIVKLGVEPKSLRGNPTIFAILYYFTIEIKNSFGFSPNESEFRVNRFTTSFI